MDLRLLYRSFPGMFLIIARETMTGEVKIARHGNTSVVETDRSRRDCAVFRHFFDQIKRIETTL